MTPQDAADGGPPVERGFGVFPLLATDPPGFGRYRLVGRLGTGGMGTVYLGRSPDDSLVAIKTIRTTLVTDDEVRARFAEEVAAARRVVPFYTPQVLDHGMDHGQPYLVTEYVPGPSLLEVVGTGGPLPPERLRSVALGVAAALVAIHSAGLVHRDLKPANVLLLPSGPRVIDFGIARALDAAAAVQTQTGTVMGSPGWIAPERLVGGRMSPASDVFSWGCLIAYAATGRHPFGEEEGPALAHRIIHASPDLGGVEPRIEVLVRGALAKDPAVRPSAQDLLTGLLGTAEQPLVAPPAGSDRVPAFPTGAPALPAPPGTVLTGEIVNDRVAGPGTRADATGTALPPGGRVGRRRAEHRVRVDRVRDHRAPGSGRRRAVMFTGAAAVTFAVAVLAAVLWQSAPGGPEGIPHGQAVETDRPGPDGQRPALPGTAPTSRAPSPAPSGSTPDPRRSTEPSPEASPETSPTPEASRDPQTRPPRDERGGNRAPEEPPGQGKKGG